MGIQRLIGRGSLHHRLGDPLLIALVHGVVGVDGGHGVPQLLPLLIGEVLPHQDVVAVGGLHRVADLPHGQGLGGVDKLADQGAGAVGQVAVAVEGVPLRHVQIAVLVPAVVAALVHHRVKLRGGVGGGADLGEELVGLLQHGGLLLVGGGGAVLVGGEGQQDVLGPGVAGLLNHGVQIGLTGLKLAPLLQGGLEILGQVGHAVELAEGRVADALLIQVLLVGHAVVGVQVLGQGLQLGVHGVLVLLAEGDALGGGMVGHGGVENAGVQGVLTQVLRRGGAVDLLLPGVVVGQIAALLGGGHALEQPEQVLVGGDLGAVHGEEHRVPGDAGGLVGDVVGIGLGRLGGAGGQPRQQHRAAHSGAQETVQFHGW